MHDTVTVHLMPRTAADFIRKPTGGTVENQNPDEKEIVASIKRAVID